MSSRTRNRSGDDRALVVYHNRFGSMHGRIRQSVAFADKGPDGEKHLVRSTLAEGLGLTDAPGAVAVYRDVLAGLEHVREVSDLRAHGFRVVLDAYATHVYLGWREVAGEAAAEYRALAVELGGAGVPNVEAALMERRLRPLHDAVAIVIDEGQLRDLVDAVGSTLAWHARAATADVPVAPARGQVSSNAGATPASSPAPGAATERPGSTTPAAADGSDRDAGPLPTAMPPAGPLPDGPLPDGMPPPGRFPHPRTFLPWRPPRPRAAPTCCAALAP